MAEMRDADRQMNLPKREEEILKFWEEHRIFEKTLAKTLRQAQGKPGKRFVFYEGPPYANGLPGIHHFEARVFKDIIIRHRAMQGFAVPRKAGWDTHGLPVEIQVEKELGLKSKRDIERYGIAKFNAKCRESVLAHKEQWERFTRRIGYWLDLEHAYLTLSTDYIETLWWVIREFAKKKLLYEDFKVVPWCPRCQTPLSSHELGFGYQTVRDRSVYVRFPLKSDQPRWRKTAILSWTTTPWTLPGNVALAVNPGEEYVRVPDPAVKHQWLILGQKPFRDMVSRSLFPPEYRSSLMLDDIDTFKGNELVGLGYEPPFAVSKLASPKSHRVYAADFVSTEEGTGVVHTAVMYGEDDYRLGKEVGLPTVHTVTETGHFTRDVPGGLAGLPVKDAGTGKTIITALRSRSLLFAEEDYEHEYPFCWRCETALLYYARQGWWVSMSVLKPKLIASNETINWVPETIKHGRFGEFLNEVRDWAFSRERYWGTPLPIWKCTGCAQVRVASSLADLDAFDPAPATLIVMRHGEALHNVRGTVNPVRAANDRKNVLTERGRRDVAASARRLKREGIQVIVASPSLRAQETAKIVARALGIKRITTEPALSDVKIGGFEGRPIAEFLEAFSRFEERFTQKPQSAENLREIRARVMRAILEIRKKHSEKHVLVVTHGEPSWMLMSALEGLPEPDYQEVLLLKPGEFRVLRIHNWPYNSAGELDLHRPYVDEIRLKCGACGGEMYRVPEVADVWFDSGAMPFAQAHYPFAFAKGRKAKDESSKLAYPADYICEGVDMTRGWFYVLLAVATALGKKAPYRNVVSLGLVLDQNGQKMSKSKGNVVDPWVMIAKYGTDAIRWYFYTINAPGDPKRFDENDVLLRLRGALATLWNSFVFFDTYVDKAKSEKRKAKGANVLDRWVVAKLNELTAGVTERLGDYDIVGAARALDQFILDDFSNWYLRRSRRRFQRPASRAEKDEAAAVTGLALLRLCELMAPFTPFLAEVIYRELKAKLGLKEESVHLRSWPKAKGRRLKELSGGMAEVRRLAALALAERAKAGIKVRQPLAKLKVKSQKLKVPGLLDVLKDEANVKEVVIDPKIDGDIGLDTIISEQLHEEGVARELVRNIQELRREAGFKPGQAARCRVSGDRDLESIVARWHRTVERETNCTLTVGGRTGGGRTVALGGRQIRISIKKT